MTPLTPARRAQFSNTTAASTKVTDFMQRQDRETCSPPSETWDNNQLNETDEDVVHFYSCPSSALERTTAKATAGLDRAVKSTSPSR